MMGRNRVRPARISASRRLSPSARRVLAKSTSRMAFLVTRPMSMMSPMSDMMFTVSPVRNNMPAMPTTDKGSDSMMASGSMNDSNCAARIRYTRITASRSASAM